MAGFQLKKYLKPTYVINCTTKSIKEKAESLTEKYKKSSEKAKSLFYFVRDGIKYNPYVSCHRLEDFIASRTLKKKEGNCVQKAVLLAALARAVGIPARLRFADIRNYLLPNKFRVLLGGRNLLVYHGYNELYIGEKWIEVTPTFDLEMCKKKHIIPVEFDGRNDAKFHSHNQDGELHIRYVRDHGYYEDLPLNEILNALTRTYGPSFTERCRQLRKRGK